MPGWSGEIHKTRQNTYVNMYVHDYLIELLQDSMQTIADLFNSSLNLPMSG